MQFIKFEKISNKWIYASKLNKEKVAEDLEFSIPDSFPKDFKWPN